MTACPPTLSMTDIKKIRSYKPFLSGRKSIEATMLSPLPVSPHFFTITIVFLPL